MGFPSLSKIVVLWLNKSASVRQTMTNDRSMN